jgi:K+-transporting ATPase KdpF subunit
MSHPEYLICGIIAALGGIYLIVALLFAERF